MKGPIIEYYNSIISSSEERVADISRKISVISFLRLSVVLLLFLFVWWQWGEPEYITAYAIISAILFLALVKLHDKQYRIKLFEEAKIRAAEDNLQKINLDLSKANTGSRYINSRHPFSYDLDIFGEKSIFALLDTTATYGGANQLAQWLDSPLSNKITEKQEIIKELSLQPEFRLNLRAGGMIVSDEIKSAKETLFSKFPDFSISRLYKILMYVAPSAILVSTILSILGIINPFIILYIFMANAGIAGLKAKHVSGLHRSLTEITTGLTTYYTLFERIEMTKFQSGPLKSLQKSLTGDNIRASVATKRLNKILHNLDQRYNGTSYIILNGLMLWDYHQLYGTDKWMKHFSSKLAVWHETLSKFDAFCALGTFAYNNPSYTYPTLDTDRKIIIEASQLGHPLIPESDCICNDIRQLDSGQFLVITGANMAGKSTYLRTVGINYVLALIGAPVFATTMTFTPVSLYTGLRTTDSLQENESYFFAELKRLQNIIERSQKGEQMFVILDEILKGTNSVDKQKGSLALITKLVKMNVTGIIATHDLMLGTLADNFPGNIFNYCFEATIDNDKLNFSYRIQQGVAKNMNAYFLMQRMGIV